MRRLLARYRIVALAHGFRSSFRDWAAEETDHSREVVETALVHVVQNKVEAAVIRAGRRHRPQLGLPLFDAGLPPFRYAGIRSGLTASVTSITPSIRVDPAACQERGDV